MSSDLKPDTYTMPLKQLLKLLETTADDATRVRRRTRTRTRPELPQDAERRNTGTYERSNV